MKAIPATTKATVRTPAAANLKAKKDALVRGERAPSRVFRIEKRADGTFSRVAVNPETQRRKSAKAWEAKSEVAKVRQSLDLSQEAFANLLEEKFIETIDINMNTITTKCKITEPKEIMAFA